MPRYYICHRTEDSYYKVCRGKDPIVFDTREEAEAKLQEFIQQTMKNEEYTSYDHFWNQLFIVEE
jgi:hypothetical protein